MRRECRRLGADADPIRRVGDDPARAGPVHGKLGDVRREETDGAGDPRARGILARRRVRVAGAAVCGDERGAMRRGMRGIETRQDRFPIEAGERTRAPQPQAVAAEGDGRDAERRPCGLDRDRAASRHGIDEESVAREARHAEERGGERGLEGGGVLPDTITSRMQALAAHEVDPCDDAQLRVDVDCDEHVRVLEVDAGRLAKRRREPVVQAPADLPFERDAPEDVLALTSSADRERGAGTHPAIEVEGRGKARSIPQGRGGIERSFPDDDAEPACDAEAGEEPGGGLQLADLGVDAARELDRSRNDACARFAQLVRHEVLEAGSASRDDADHEGRKRDARERACGRVLTGRATAAATRDFAAKAGTAAGHFRGGLGVTLSSFGLGTYLGDRDGATDEAMAKAVADVVTRGLNVVDAAIVYRDERSERSVGEGLRRAVARGLDRDAVFVSTKGGYLPSSVPREVVRPADVANGSNCISPAFLRWAIRQSRENLGLATVDLYYLHNPEDHVPRLGLDGFLAALRESFGMLEELADAGEIGAYGLATWPGLRVPAAHGQHIPLARVVALAREVGGANHRLRAIQLPLNLAMREAIATPTQDVDGTLLPAIEAARRLGLAVFTSASTMQGRLAPQVPQALADRLPGAEGSPTRALLQWTRSCPGVTSALVGMTRAEHREEDVQLALHPPLPAETAMALAGEG